MGKLRNAAAGLCIAIGIVLLATAIPAAWLNRIVMDEDRWVETMAPLARDASVQDFVAAKATDSLFAGVDVQSYVSKALQFLPKQGQVLAAPITAATQSYVEDAATKFVRSEQFPQLWDQMNRLMHRAFIVSVTQRSGGVVNNQAGRITIDMGVLIDRVKSQLADKSFGLVNLLPTPASLHAVVLVDSPALARMGRVIQVLNALAPVLPFVAAVLLALGVAIAVDRRKAVLWLGIGTVVVTLLPLLAISLGQYPFAQAALRTGQVPILVAQTAYDTVFRGLVHAEQLFAVLGIVFVVGAMVAGPSRWAAALRSRLTIRLFGRTRLRASTPADPPDPSAAA